MDKNKKVIPKVKKVIKGLKKASKLHAGQAKVLKTIIKKRQNMDKIDTRTQRQILSRKSKSKPVRKDFKTIRSEMDPRDRQEMIKKGKLQKVKPLNQSKPLPTKPQPRKMKKGGKAQ